MVSVVWAISPGLWSKNIPQHVPGHQGQTHIQKVSSETTRQKGGIRYPTRQFCWDEHNDIKWDLHDIYHVIILSRVISPPH